MSDTAHPVTEKASDQRPEHPDFWDKRFSQGVTPWDAGQVPPAFAAFASQQQPRSTLIPGCGSAWEAAHLARLGWPVTAIDFSPVAIAAARQAVADQSVELIHGDFFTFTPKTEFQLIYERAFLCALPHRLWADWGHRVAELLPSGGLLAGFFFFDDQPKGPPFGIRHEALHALLDSNFNRIEDVAVADSLPVFAGRERWQVWRRR